MKTYLVGGAVRDQALGLPVNDRDYVIVGAMPADLLNLGFKQVGADFPVFLHPITSEEHALARIERKTGPGYHGFTVIADDTVTLEDDLARRDLTINSMALNSDGELSDPFGGLQDLAARVLRHTSPAFAEDPLRVLRLARFAGRYEPQGFRVHPTTFDLCKQMIEAGELDHLTQERVWLEFSKALDTGFMRFYHVLYQLGAFRLVKGLAPFAAVSAGDVAHVLMTTVNLTEWRHEVVLGTLLHLGQHRGHRLTQAEARGLSAETLKVADLLKHDWLDFEPKALYSRLVKSGALRGGWEFIKSALSLLDKQLVELNGAALNRALSVTAAQFSELEGKALGDAIRDARILAVSHV